MIIRGHLQEIKQANEMKMKMKMKMKVKMKVQVKVKMIFVKR